ncbi:MAG: helix-hairpin-helix domain-containing protein [Chloroflexi bacterium]|nr:helix-hairpin-helix domain-containing protein [Chloroflexota bacterium]
MKTWLLLAYGVLIGLIAAGLILLISSQPHGSAILLTPAPTPGALIVQVSGAVANPGVYHLPRGSRVEDAVLAAGGVLSNTDGQSINLAAPLQDGMKINLPSILATQPSGLSEDPTRMESVVLPTPIVEFPININQASQEELDALPGIGPQKALDIIKYRENQGLFTTIEEIQSVSGIGPATFEKIKALITVGLIN